MNVMNLAEHLFNPLAFGESEGKRGRLGGNNLNQQEPQIHRRHAEAICPTMPQCRHGATPSAGHTLHQSPGADSSLHKTRRRERALRSMRVRSADTSGTLSRVHLSIRPEWRCAKGQISANTCQEGLDTSGLSFFFSLIYEKCLQI